MRENICRRLAVGVTGVLVAALAAGAAGSAGSATAATTTEPAPYYFSSDGQDSVQALSNLARMAMIPTADTGWVPDTDPPLTDDKACPASRCRDYLLPGVTGIDRKRPRVRVLLPVGYASRPAARYPVVYLFNGSLSPYYRWTRATELTAMSRSMKAIFVMPDGTHDGNAGYFSDWKDGSYAWETWHTRHLVPWVDRTFRTIRGARAAAGASMGAQGALTYAARHPGLFKAVLSISGLVDTSSLAQNGTVAQDLPDAVKAPANIGGADLRRVWGDPVLEQASWSAHNPVDQVAGLHDVALFIAAGTGYPHYDPDDPVHSGATEQNLWNQQRKLFLGLAREKIPYEARIAPGQLHDWPYFHAAMQWGLPRIIQAARG